jgi:hypothetical protein
MAGTWPANVAFTAFTGSGAGCATRVSGMTIMAKTLRKFLLSKLLWFMETHYNLFGAECRAIHSKHGSGSWEMSSCKAKRNIAR